MLTDRITISTIINRKQETQIYNILTQIGGRRPITKGDGSMKYFYNDKKYNISIELVTPWNYFSISINPMKLSRGEVNIGSITSNQLKKNIKKAHDLCQEILQMQLLPFWLWKIEYIEIKKDTVHFSIDEKKTVLKTLQSNGGGHLKRTTYGNNGTQFKGKGIKIKFYDKIAEVIENYFKKGKAIVLPYGETLNRLERTSRIEVSFSQRKLQKALSNISDKDVRIVTLGQIINPYILIALFNSTLVRFNLGLSIRSLDNTLKMISTKSKTKKMRFNLITFVRYINTHGVNATRCMYKHLFYSYRNKLNGIGVNMLCLPNNSKFTFNALIDYKFVNLKYLNEFISFFEIKISFSAKYNIYVLYNLFKSFKIIIRL